MISYNPRGLEPQQVEESRRQHGDNVITPPKDDSAWKLLLEKFRDPIIQILLAAAVLSLAIGFIHRDFTESVGIICAIILASCVGFWFEGDAQRRFRRRNQGNDDIPVKVMRGGSMCEIPRRDVVVGDVVHIESGETVPADGELVEAVSLKINESTLTGETEVAKTVDEAFFVVVVFFFDVGGVVVDDLVLSCLEVSCIFFRGGVFGGSGVCGGVGVFAGSYGLSGLFGVVCAAGEHGSNHDDDEKQREELLQILFHLNPPVLI